MHFVPFATVTPLKTLHSTIRNMRRRRNPDPVADFAESDILTVQRAAAAVIATATGTAAEEVVAEVEEEQQQQQEHEEAVASSGCESQSCE
eukprot:gene5795-biopygen7193